MCISPVRIRNPNYGHDPVGVYAYKDCVSTYINVPCGYCSECIAVKQMSVIQRVQMEELNNYIFFCTLTYNNESLPVLTTSNGYDIRYADYRDVSLMIKRLRNHNAFGRKFRFFGVSELGKERSRPHFHILFFVPKCEGDTFQDICNLEFKLRNAVLSEWRRNYGSNRKPIWKPCCTYVRKFIHGRLKTNFDLHYVNPIYSAGGTADVGFYVTKYMLKPCDRVVRLQQALHLNLDPVEYESVWKIVRPRSFSSLKFGFGDQDNVRDYIRMCVERSKVESDAPKFYNPVNGNTFPLSRYYLSRGSFYTYSDFIYFSEKSKLIDNVVIDERDISVKDRSISKYNRNVLLSDSHDESYIFDDLS